MLKLMVPKVKNVVKKCTSLSIVYCICIDYSVFLFIFLSICGEVHMVVVLLIRIIFFFCLAKIDIIYIEKYQWY